MINKRLYRAREKLREEKIAIGLPGAAEIDKRLKAVLRTIYLLFSEGYYSVSHNQTLRKELCLEAMRLCYMLVENLHTNRPEVNALLSLMCFHASRFEARINNNGDLILYDDQDTGLWNTELIAKGAYYLNCAAKGDTLSKYHLEAAIAYWYTRKTDSKVKWMNILELHDQLLQIEYSPVAALNRVYAVSQTKGKKTAIEEALSLRMDNNHFYFALLGELHTDMNNKKAKRYFRNALSLARTSADKKAMQTKIEKLGI